MGELNVFSALRLASRQKSVGVLSSVDNRGGWWPLVREPFAGAWQQNIEIRQDLAFANWCVFACMTLIAGEIGKMRLMLVERMADTTWKETDSPSFSPVLRSPNRYQITQKFIEQWLLSKLSHGNTYVLKQRDQRNVVVALYVLDPNRVRPLVGPDGAVYYQLQGDELSQIPGGLPAVPASEIIHDRMWCLFHPLCGLSPLYACALGAIQGLNIQNHSAKFFQNAARPSGVLTAPGHISPELAQELKDRWETGYSGVNRGKVAVLGDDLKFQPLAEKAVDAQLVDQLKLTAVMVCGTFHVPGYMVGAEPIPTNNNVAALEMQFYKKALQPMVKSIEDLLDLGLGLDVPIKGPDGMRQLGTYFDIDELLKMDKVSQLTALKLGLDSPIYASNEARLVMNLSPVEGGDSPMAQQQEYSLAALAKRDAGADPFASASPPAAPAPAPAAPAPPQPDPAAGKAAELVQQMAGLMREQLEAAKAAEADRAACAEAATAENAKIIKDLAAEMRSEREELRKPPEPVAATGKELDDAEVSQFMDHIVKGLECEPT